MSPRESQEKEGGGEGTKVTTDDGVEGSIRSIAENDRGQAGQSDSKGVPHDKETMSEVAKDTQAEGTDTDIGGPRAKQKGVRGAEREEERVKGSRKDQNANTRKMNTEGRHAKMLNRDLD